MPPVRRGASVQMRRAWLSLLPGDADLVRTASEPLLRPYGEVRERVPVGACVALIVAVRCGAPTGGDTVWTKSESCGGRMSFQTPDRERGGEDPSP
ncbi:hypothetical protein SY2F82_41530 [Streptomyces sp. Y2F8-2]|nr:hypothetical protein SY2F82_41530 [Streptomyces sp. Y2F8-2]